MINPKYVQSLILQDLWSLLFGWKPNVLTGHSSMLPVIPSYARWESERREIKLSCGNTERSHRGETETETETGGGACLLTTLRAEATTQRYNACLYISKVLGLCHSTYTHTCSKKRRREKNFLISNFKKNFQWHKAFCDLYLPITTPHVLHTECSQCKAPLYQQESCLNYLYYLKIIVIL